MGYFDNGNGFNDFFLVHFGSWTIEVSNNMCHACFVSSKGSEVNYNALG